MASPLEPTDSIGSLSNRKKCRLYRRYNSNSSFSSELDKDSMASNEFPMRVPLETVQIGPWRYTSRDVEETYSEGYVSGDIELLYDQESADLIIKTNVEGTRNALPASYRVKSVSAADLSLFSVVPNSLESMVVKLVMETDEKITYMPLDTEARGENSSGSKSAAKGVESSEAEGEDGIGKAELAAKETAAKKESSGSSKESRELDVYIVRLTASVHETGHLRDILHFQNSPCNLTLGSEACEKSLTHKDPQEASAKPHLTLIEGLPYWVRYVPWMIYSRRTRRILQQVLFLYTLLSVLWALWQLYRHVNIIRVVIQPIIATLRYYLSSVVELFDWMFAVFTVWWHTLLSPLNVLRTLLLAPMLRLFTDFKWMFYPLYLSLSHLFRSTGLLTVFTGVASTLYVVLRHTGSILWMIFQVLLKPLNYIWMNILNARVAVQSMDFQRMRLSWVFSLVMNSIRSIFRGLATFVGYTRKEKIIKKAMESSASSPLVSPVSSPSTARRRNESMPMIYSSPLTKQY